MKVEEAETTMGLEPSSYDRTMLDKAFRKMSLQLHPDKNQSDPKATENFQHLGNCYLRLQRKLAGHGGDDDDDDDDGGDWGSDDDDDDDDYAPSSGDGDDGKNFAARGGGRSQGFGSRGSAGGGPGASFGPGMTEDEFFEYLFRMGAFGSCSGHGGSGEDGEDEAECNCRQCRAARRKDADDEEGQERRRAFGAARSAAKESMRQKQREAREASKARFQEEVAREAKLEPLRRAARAVYEGNSNKDGNSSAGGAEGSSSSSSSSSTGNEDGKWSVMALAAEIQRRGGLNLRVSVNIRGHVIIAPRSKLVEALVFDDVELQQQQQQQQREEAKAIEEAGGEVARAAQVAKEQALAEDARVAKELKEVETKEKKKLKEVERKRLQKEEKGRKAAREEDERRDQAAWAAQQVEARAALVEGARLKQQRLADEAQAAKELSEQQAAAKARADALVLAVEQERLAKELKAKDAAKAVAARKVLEQERLAREKSEAAEVEALAVARRLERRTAKELKRIKAQELQAAQEAEAAQKRLDKKLRTAARRSGGGCGGGGVWEDQEECTICLDPLWGRRGKELVAGEGSLGGESGGGTEALVGNSGLHRFPSQVCELHCGHRYHTSCVRAVGAHNSAMASNATMAAGDGSANMTEEDRELIEYAMAATMGLATAAVDATAVDAASVDAAGAAATARGEGDDDGGAQRNTPPLPPIECPQCRKTSTVAPRVLANIPNEELTAASSSPGLERDDDGVDGPFSPSLPSNEKTRAKARAKARRKQEQEQQDREEEERRQQEAAETATEAAASSFNEEERRRRQFFGAMRALGVSERGAAALAAEEFGLAELVGLNLGRGAERDLAEAGVPVGSSDSVRLLSWIASMQRRPAVAAAKGQQQKGGSSVGAGEGGEANLQQSKKRLVASRDGKTQKRAPKGDQHSKKGEESSEEEDEEVEDGGGGDDRGGGGRDKKKKKKKRGASSLFSAVATFFSAAAAAESLEPVLGFLGLTHKKNKRGRRPPAHLRTMGLVPAETAVVGEDDPDDGYFTAKGRGFTLLEVGLFRGLAIAVAFLAVGVFAYWNWSGV